MDLNNHLLYIDITNQCNLNCDFCMYKEERKKNLINLKLNDFSKNNLSNILNHPETERLIISGEGEPFNNFQSIIEILKLSKGNKNIQMISNGLWLISNNSGEILKKLNTLKNKKNDKYQIRISCDSFHIKRISKERYKKIVSKIINEIKSGSEIEICFRGILEEKNRILSLFKDYFIVNEKDIKFDSITNLETDIIINKKIKLNFIFKNIVDLDNHKDKNSLNQYIASLEEIYNKPFTLGHLKKGKNGMDITIKPNGDLFFYGAEIYPIFNIYNDNITIEKLNTILTNNRILNKLYSMPFKKLISSLQKYEPFKKIILSINNPYWVIKKMYSYDKNKFNEILKC